MNVIAYSRNDEEFELLLCRDSARVKARWLHSDGLSYMQPNERVMVFITLRNYAELETGWMLRLADRVRRKE